jgi:hypothetical protein
VPSIFKRSGLGRVIHVLSLLLLAACVGDRRTGAVPTRPGNEDTSLKRLQAIFAPEALHVERHTDGSLRYLGGADIAPSCHGSGGTTVEELGTLLACFVSARQGDLVPKGESVDAQSIRPVQVSTKRCPYTVKNWRLEDSAGELS